LINRTEWKKPFEVEENWWLLSGVKLKKQPIVLLSEFDGEEEENLLLRYMVKWKKHPDFRENFKLDDGDASHSIEIDPNNINSNGVRVNLRSHLIHTGFPKRSPERVKNYCIRSLEWKPEEFLEGKDSVKELKKIALVTLWEESGLWRKSYALLQWFLVSAKEIKPNFLNLHLYWWMKIAVISSLAQLAFLCKEALRMRLHVFPIPRKWLCVIPLKGTWWDWV
jgi:hypothetical protein